MKKTKLFFSLFVFLILSHSASALNSYQPRVECIGDSITNAGQNSDNFGYRDDLQTLLGFGRYNFVGSKVNPSTDLTYDVDHEGVAGNKAADVVARLSTALNYIPSPNPKGSMVLLHIGTNDVGVTADATTTSQVQSIVSSIVSNDANVTIYVALIIPHASALSSTANVNINSLNTSLNTMLTTMRASNSKINIVDLNAKFKSNASFAADYYTGGDATHPNASGYAAMAAGWYACINNSSAQYCNGN